MALSGGSWGTREELLHPRDRLGRFRRKWSLPKGTVDKLMGILDAFKPRSFGSQQQASQWAFNQSAKKGAGKFQDFARLGDFHNANNDLRSGQMTPSTQKFVTAYDKAAFESEEDIVLFRRVGPEAFGVSPEMMNAEEGGLEDTLLGTTIVDKGYTSTNVGAPIGNAPITMAIAAPKGTRMMAPARSQGDPQIILDRDQKLHVSKVEPDGRGGFNVMAIITDEGGPEEHEVIAEGQVPDQATREGDIVRQEDIRAKRMGVLNDEQVQAEEGQRITQARQAQEGLVQEQQRRIARMGKDRPAPQGPGPAPRTEPLQSEMLGGHPAAPVEPEAEPEPVRLQDFRQAFRDANIEVPSAGQRRRQFNAAYLGILQGKRDPEDLLRELEADIRDNDGLMDDLTTRDTPIAEVRNLEADNARLTQLADLIAEQHGFERREMSKAERPREVATPDSVPPEGASKGGTDIQGLTDQQKTDVENRVKRLKAEGRFNPENEEHQRVQNLVDQIEAEREGREIPAPFEQPRVSGVPQLEARKARQAAKKAAPPVKKAAPAKAAPAKPSEEMTPEERIARLDEILRGENVPGEEGGEGDPLESMSRNELVEEAKRRGIDRVPTSWNKTKIKDAIRGGEVKAKAAPVSKATSAEAVEAGDLDNMTKNDLLAEARGRGVEVKNWWDKTRIKSAIRGETAPAKKAAPAKAAPVKKAASPAEIPLSPERQRRAEEAGRDAAAGFARDILENVNKGASDRALTTLVNNRLKRFRIERDGDRYIMHLPGGDVDLADTNLPDTPDIAAGRMLAGLAADVDVNDKPGTLARIRERMGGQAPGAAVTPQLSQAAEGLNLGERGPDKRMMDALQAKVDGTDTIFKGNDIGRALTQREIADEIDDMLQSETTGPGLQARRLARGSSETGLDSAKAKAIEDLKRRERDWRRLSNRLRGRHQETGIDNPVAERKLTTADRIGEFEGAFISKFRILDPDRAARRSILEVQDDISSGRITPAEGIRRLESDIEFNKDDLAAIEEDLRNTDNPKEIADLRKQKAALSKDIQFQERMSEFVRDHFRDAPEVTPGEIKERLPEPVRQQLEAATPQEIKETAKLTGVPEPKGDTKEEMVDDLLGMLAKESVAKKAAPAKVQAPVKKTPAPEVRPTPETSRYQRVDINGIADGLQLGHADDQKVLRGIQATLDSEKTSPAAIGKGLLKSVNSPTGLRTRASLLPEGRERDDLNFRANEMEKLAERLQRTRRKANKPEAPRDPNEGKITPDEQEQLVQVADLTGTPVERLQAQAQAKKDAEASAKPISERIVDVLRTVGTEDEGRTLLNKKLKAELVDIAKAAGVGTKSRDTKPQITDAILRQTVTRRLETEALGRRARPVSATPGDIGPEIKTVASPRDLSPVQISRADHLTPESRRALDNLGPAGHPRIAAISDTEEKIREAHFMLAMPGGSNDTWVSLEDLRKLVGNQTTREDLDAALIRMHQRRGPENFQMVPQSYARENAATRIPASIQRGGNELNQFRLDDPRLARVGEFGVGEMATELEARRSGGERKRMMSLLSDADLQAEIDSRVARDPLARQDLEQTQRVSTLRQRAIESLREQGFDNPRPEMVREQMNTLADIEHRDLIRERSGGGAPTPTKAVRPLMAPPAPAAAPVTSPVTAPGVPTADQISQPADLLEALNNSDDAAGLRRLLANRKFSKQFLADSLRINDVSPSKGSKSTRADLVDDLIKQTGTRRPAVLDTPTPPAKKAPAKRVPKPPEEKFRNVTNAKIEKMNDQELVDLFEHESRKEVINAERIQFIYDVMGRREQATEEENARRAEAEAPLYEEVDRLVEGGMDPRQAYAQAFNLDPEQVEQEDLRRQLDRFRAPGVTREQQVKTLYKEQVAIAYVQAEAETNGHMLNPAGRAAGIDPFTLFTGPRARAEKYASDELKDFWDAHGRTTYTEFRGQMLGGRADRAATRAAREGERGFRR